jgi:hypothetical protein
MPPRQSQTLPNIQSVPKNSPLIIAPRIVGDYKNRQWHFVISDGKSVEIISNYPNVTKFNNHKQPTRKR